MPEPGASSSQAGAWSRAYWTPELLTPCGTIGHTIASADTTKSMTTGRSFVSSASLIAASTSYSFSTRMPSAP
jgi:hypothetical protein